MSITKQQEDFFSLIQKRLDKLELPKYPRSLYDPVQYTLSLGGKRIRPYFTLTGCGLCDGDPSEALAAGVAIELLHNFTLLHDDIMDAAETRRGEASVFKKWDASTAILSGDAMYAWAFEQLQYYGQQERYNKQQYVQIMDIFLESARVVCEGQAYDLEFEQKKHVTVDEYLNMIEGKTAALISASFKLGGAVAGTGQDCLYQLQEIGTSVGIAFQIQDDLLDVIADPTKFGKKRGGDIAEGKKTYLSILSLAWGNSQQKELLQSVFKKKSVQQKEVDQVINIYNTLGVIDKTRDVIKDYYRQAMEHLDYFKSSTYKKDLVTFLNNLVNREF